MHPSSRLLLLRAKQKLYSASLSLDSAAATASRLAKSTSQSSFLHNSTIRRNSNDSVPPQRVQQPAGGLESQAQESEAKPPAMDPQTGEMKLRQDIDASISWSKV